MSDKILTEAFDKIKAIEESDDPFCVNEAPDASDDPFCINEAPYVIEEPEAIDHLGEMESQLDNLRDGMQEMEEIQQELEEVRERLDSAIRAYRPSTHASWQAYGLARLAILIGNGEYASADDSIQTLIDQMRKDYEATKEHMGGM